MTWQIRWMLRALKDARKLSKQNRKRVITAIERFAETGAGDIRQLTDVRPPEWRLRVGDTRIRFQKDPAEASLLILRVRPRDKAY